MSHCLHQSTWVGCYPFPLLILNLGWSFYCNSWTVYIYLYISLIFKAGLEKAPRLAKIGKPRHAWTLLYSLCIYYNILCIYFSSRLVHLLHSNISNWFTVCVYCVLSYKIYCAYTSSNGVMALMNKISVFHISYIYI